MDVKVGYDGNADDTGFARSGDTLKTEGLTNCIAVVAVDSLNRGAVMRHYDTVRAYESGGGSAMKFSEAKLKILKDELTKMLRENVGDPSATAHFTVGLGSLGVNLPNLKSAAAGAFNTEPIQTNGEFSFKVPPAIKQTTREAMANKKTPLLGTPPKKGYGTF